MNEIEHNPHEKRPNNRIWWMWLAALILLWTWHLMRRPFDWDNFAIGAISGMVIAAWAIDITGNKLPAWMLPRSSKRR